jgi:hypothetical protein
MTKSNLTFPIILILILVVCVCLIAIVGGIAYGVYEFGKNLHVIPTPLPVFTPTFFEITRQPLDGDNLSTLLALEKTIVPSRDLAALACRFNGVCNVPETLDPPPVPYIVGSQIATREYIPRFPPLWNI